ncbi:MAG: hypothetical protein IMF17_06450, partial [Proteobacteria bacterium]|nr:hypothetical protein [Pseudomonadota bacterium]
MSKNLTIGEMTALVSAIVAVIGLIWGVYKYYKPRSVSSDITISALRDAGRLKGVAGVEPFSSSEYQSAIYPEGVRAAFLIAHNLASNDPVTLTDISLDIERVSERNPELSKWMIDAS